MTNRWLKLVVAMGLAGLVMLLLQNSSPEEQLQAGFEASCISQNGLLSELLPAQVPAFCSCAASALAVEFNPAELDSVLNSGTPSEDQEARATAVMGACLAQVQDPASPLLPELLPPLPGTGSTTDNPAN